MLESRSRMRPRLATIHRGLLHETKKSPQKGYAKKKKRLKKSERDGRALGTNVFLQATGMGETSVIGERQRLKTDRSLTLETFRNRLECLTAQHRGKLKWGGRQNVKK